MAQCHQQQQINQSTDKDILGLNCHQIFKTPVSKRLATKNFILYLYTRPDLSLILSVCDSAYVYVLNLPILEME